MNKVRLLVAACFLGVPTGNVVAQTPVGITVQFEFRSYEPIESVGKLKVKIKLSDIPKQDVKVTYATGDSVADPKAVADTDYVKISPTEITIAKDADPPEKVIEVEIKDNDIADANRLFVLVLTNPVNASLGSFSVATVTIVDDDAPPVVQFENIGYFVKEGKNVAAEIAFVSDRSYKKDVEVQFSFTDSTAKSGVDYTAPTELKAVITAGTTRKTFKVDIIDNDKEDSTRQTKIDITKVTDCTKGSVVTTYLNILDDDKKGDLKLFSVTFKSLAKTVMADVPMTADWKDMAANGPHWRDNNLNQTIEYDRTVAFDKTKEFQWPVCYVRNTSVTISAKLTMDPKLKNAVKIKAAGANGGLSVELAADSVPNDDGSEHTFPDKSFTAPNTIRYLGPLTLNWTYSTDGGTTWISVGKSDHVINITLDTPLSLANETFLKIGCKAADGESVAVNATKKINGYFAGLNVTRASDGAQLKYYSPINQITDSAGLLLEKSGQCGAWCNLYMNTLRNQGIGGAKLVEITTKANSGNLVEQRGWLLIKNWTFKGKGKVYSDDYKDFTYLWLGLPKTGITATAAGRIPAQGNNASPSEFQNHLVVIYDNATNFGTLNGKYFDPSYGAGPYTSREWENAALAGVGVDVGQLAVNKLAKVRPTDIAADFCDFTIEPKKKK